MAESQAVLSIFNLALLHIGNPAIVAPEDSPVCQRFYPSVRDKLLSWAPWTFATTRQTLHRLDVDTPDSEYAYLYALPTQPYPLRLLDIDTRGARYSREMYHAPLTPETQIAVILTNAGSVVVKYIARVSESMFPPLFADTLGLWLGLSIAERQTGKANLRRQLYAELQVQMQRLIDVDGHQDSPPRALNESYLWARGASDDFYPVLGDYEEPL